ncbi:hypothetical protein CCUS01_04652 [Colletotrichum cuscutae]|uniref:Uncharacterized protein n=1 Tax=Colletotrichum cuscutae TaxID=1209917 RepID=A0AAI9VCA6_9PEZI|nr:hypothetical protein CCUS01_04652 [Colletotrichum cuscutae]
MGRSQVVVTVQFGSSSHVLFDGLLAIVITVVCVAFEFMNIHEGHIWRQNRRCVIYAQSALVPLLKKRYACSVETCGPIILAFAMGAHQAPIQITKTMRTQQPFQRGQRAEGRTVNTEYAGTYMLANREHHTGWHSKEALTAFHIGQLCATRLILVPVIPLPAQMPIHEAWGSGKGMRWIFWGFAIRVLMFTGTPYWEPVYVHKRQLSLMGHTKVTQQSTIHHIEQHTARVPLLLSAFIGEVDDSTILKYPLEPGGDLTRLELEHKNSHHRFTETGLYLERAVSGTIFKYLTASNIPAPSLQQRLAWCRELSEAVEHPTNLADFQGRYLSEDAVSVFFFKTDFFALGYCYHGLHEVFSRMILLLYNSAGEVLEDIRADFINIEGFRLVEDKDGERIDSQKTYRPTLGRWSLRLQRFRKEDRYFFFMLRIVAISGRLSKNKVLDWPAYLRIKISSFDINEGEDGSMKIHSWELNYCRLYAAVELDFQSDINAFAFQCEQSLSVIPRCDRLRQSSFQCADGDDVSRCVEGFVIGSNGYPMHALPGGAGTPYVKLSGTNKPTKPSLDSFFPATEVTICSVHLRRIRRFLFVACIPLMLSLLKIGNPHRLNEVGKLAVHIEWGVKWMGVLRKKDHQPVYRVHSGPSRPWTHYSVITKLPSKPTDPPAGSRLSTVIEAFVSFFTPYCTTFWPRWMMKLLVYVNNFGKSNIDVKKPKVVYWKNNANARKNNADKYLESCHPLSLAVQVATRPTRPAAFTLDKSFRRMTSRRDKRSRVPIPASVRICYRDMVENASHTNLGQTDNARTYSCRDVSLDITKPQTPAQGEGKGNRADQFYIYRTSDGRNVPTVAIEYKALHKLRYNEVVTGLEFEIWLEHRSLPLSYMYTGKAFVFLHIPDNPTSIYYPIHVPNLDLLYRSSPSSFRPSVQNRLLRPSTTLPRLLQGFKRSPIRTRSRYKQADSNTKHRSDSGNDERVIPPSPTPTRSIHTELTKIAENIGSISEQISGTMDISTSLAKDRGRDANTVPLYLSGSVVSLFKVRLSSYGYTLMAKGVKSLDLARLQHENEVTCKSGPTIQLIIAGRPLFDSANQAISTDVVSMLGILHGDAEPRNVLRDTFRCRPPLGSLSSNGQTQKRKRGGGGGMLDKRRKGDFTKELESVVERCYLCGQVGLMLKKMDQGETKAKRSPRTNHSEAINLPGESLTEFQLRNKGYKLTYQSPDFLIAIFLVI